MPRAWRVLAALSLLLAAVCSVAAEVCPPAQTAVGDAAKESAAARDRGMLWRISRDGRTSWLFGTLHVGKPSWRHFGPRLAGALRDSDVLALEIDPAAPELAAALLEPGPAPAVPAPLQARLDQAFERACLPRTALSGLHPVMQATMLLVLEARWFGLDTSGASEFLLLQDARSRGLRVVALETAAQQKAALLPVGSGDALAALEQSLNHLEDQSGRRVLQRLVQARERGDLATLAQYERWCECLQSEEDRAALRRLNDARNPALADGIARQHAAGGRVFAAVGALHMTGPQALPLLMAERGFSVERVEFDPP